MSGYNTNLAAEFYVLSMLHRLGADAALTLGNKKGVDIMVARAAGEAVTVEVKGSAKGYDWPAGNIQSANPERHFFALVELRGADCSCHRRSSMLGGPAHGVGPLPSPVQDPAERLAIRSAQEGPAVRERLVADHG